MLPGVLTLNTKLRSTCRLADFMQQVAPHNHRLNGYLWHVYTFSENGGSSLCKTHEPHVFGKHWWLACLISQWVNSVPPYVRKLHFMYETIRTSGKCRWNMYRTSSKFRWSIYRTLRKRRGTLRIVHKVERSSPTVIYLYIKCVEHVKCWHRVLSLWKY